MTYQEYVRSLDNPATSYWLKARLSEIENRDIVDVLRDINILQLVAQAKFEEVKA